MDSGSGCHRVRYRAQPRHHVRPSIRFGSAVQYRILLDSVPWADCIRLVEANYRQPGVSDPGLQFE